MKKSRLKDRFRSRRARFPEESRLKWLPPLLDAYALIDKGIEIAVGREEARRKDGLACRRGCSSCCRTHSDIPVYPHELMGIYWFVTEKMPAPERLEVKARLEGHEGRPPCPFLVGGACSIHVVRPAACRQFNVFGTPCAEGEDPFFTRRKDVLTPIQDYADRAFAAVLTLYRPDVRAGDLEEARKIIHTEARNLQAHDWRELVRIMDRHDRRAGPAPE
ncbi:MAG: YkgJ family cysteine cluster protein [Thermodesulfovibrionales bacterium]